MKKAFLNKKVLAVFILCAVMASLMVPSAFAAIETSSILNNKTHPFLVMDVQSYITAEEYDDVLIHTNDGSPTQKWSQYNESGLTVIKSDTDDDLSLSYVGYQHPCRMTYWELVYNSVKEADLSVTNFAQNTSEEYVVIRLKDDINRALGSPTSAYAGSRLYWYWAPSASNDEKWEF